MMKRQRREDEARAIARAVKRSARQHVRRASRIPRWSHTSVHHPHPHIICVRTHTLTHRVHGVTHARTGLTPHPYLPTPTDPVLVVYLFLFVWYTCMATNPEKSARRNSRRKTSFSSSFSRTHRTPDGSTGAAMGAAQDRSQQATP